MAKSAQSVSTVVRDDFFNDPFFKDWWADFDMPFKTVQFNRQVSGKHRLPYWPPDHRETCSDGDHLSLISKLCHFTSYELSYFN